MPDRQVSDEIREAFARLTGRLEDASVVAAKAQGVLTSADAKESCSQLADALQVILGEVEAIRGRFE